MKVFSGHKDRTGDPCHPELRHTGEQDIVEIAEDIFLQR